MHSRTQTHPYTNNSLAIRQEIQRFESVHPSIYAIYDLIDLLPDGLGGVAQQIRDHVVCIEDSFVNSQEWTLSRSVPDLRLGILGSLSSGKSALVHRYLTGSYMQEESPEGGRFKKECIVDNQSYLLLIRDEGGPPELQFTAWVDAVIFVFSLENESSFNAIYNYYTKMSHYRSSGEIPLILVGTQDAISENNPRVIDDARARKLATDLKRCSYYETCATYGLNVERVFQDACQKIVQQRLCALGNCITPTNSRPSTPNNHFCPVATCVPRHVPVNTSNNGFSATGHSSPSHNHTLMHKDSFSLGRQAHPLSASTQHLYRPSEKSEPVFRYNEEKWNSSSTLGSHGSSQALLVQTENNNLSRFSVPQNVDNNVQATQKDKDITTPSSTPTTSRKSRRRSNLFTPSKKGDDRLKNGGDIGSGRAIPIKQGYLYKRSNKPLNKEWKKKYVTLCDNGRLTYHPSLHDYMDDVHGKEISLQYVTVKVPGQKPRGSKSIITVAGTNGTSGINEGLGGLCLSGSKEKRLMEKVLLTAFETVKDPGRYIQASGDETTLTNCNAFINGDNIKTTDTPNVKKRHRRIKSNSVKNSEYDDSDGFEFYIVSLDNKQWHFDAISSEERDDWVSAIEQQILSSLQSNESSKTNKRSNAAETATLQIVRSRIPGNDFCADCDSPNPSWASLNLGILICIECSGVHRNLGSHISKVRSLDLDEWPAAHLSVMLAIGNSLANSIWECRIQNLTKPSTSSPHEEKERWIRAKYETKEFLPLLDHSLLLSQQLIDSVCSSNVKGIATVLARASAEDVNSTVGTRDLRTPLHLACAMGNLAVAQLLIWYGANVSALDQDGRTCLTYARTALGKNAPTTTSETSLGFGSALIELLQSNGCPDVSAPSGGTLPRRRGSQQLPHFEKISSSVL